MEQYIEIACAADDAYVQHLGVMLISLFENTPSRVHIHLFSASFNQTNQDDIGKLVHSYNQRFSFYSISAADFKGFFISEHISLATYYRIVIPEKIPQTVKKLIYLDADIVVVKDVQQLWDIPIGHNHILGAVPETYASTNRQRLNLPEGFSYFNAGILLMDLDRWRTENVTSRVLKFIGDFPEKIVLWDQDALNACLYDRWGRIPSEWNVQTGMYTEDAGMIRSTFDEEKEKILRNAAIIHFTGASKPWNYMNLHPARKVYLQYLKRSQWKDFTYSDKTFSKRILKLVKKVVGEKSYEKIMRPDISSS